VHSVRVLFGDLPADLHDAVSEVVAGEPDFELVGVAAKPSALLYAAGTLRADVVVVAAAGGEMPGVATHLLDQYPGIRVVAVAPQAGTALVYALAPRVDRFTGSSPAELVRALRRACHPVA
jgi:hypothetical protein